MYVKTTGNYTCNYGPGLMVHRYTKLKLPMEVHGGTEVSVRTMMTGLPVEQQSHHGIQLATSTLYNGVPLTPHSHT